MIGGTNGIHDEFKPSDEDWACAQKLIDEGWKQVSSRYRTVARLPDDYPTVEEMFDACWDTRWSSYFKSRMDQWLDSQKRYDLRCSSYSDKLELSITVFKAFKFLGGVTA